jgi:hypothetical protein
MGVVMRGDITHGVLLFPCPKCDDTIEVGLHIVAVAAHPTRKSGATGTYYGHNVEFAAEAPSLHGEFWGHLVRCHQPNPHPYVKSQ